MRIVPITREFLRNNLNIPHEYWGEDHFLMELPGKWDYSIAAIDHGKIIGYLIASDKTEKIHIHKFMVGPQFQSQGIGKALLKEIINISLNNNKLSITLKVYTDNQRAIKFYLEKGFNIIQSNGELHSMRLDLTRK
jgi:ribosomal protein S18 acetylase RimI-like enzyme